MAEEYEVFDWDSEIEEDGGGFRLLEPGVYPFEVTKIEKEYYSGGQNAPACPRAQVSMRVGNPGETTVITDSFLLYSKMEWKISNFFRAIGHKKQGERVKMNWDADFLVGKRGMCEVSNREFTFTRGERAGEKGKANDITNYLDPTDGADAAGDDDGDDW